MHASLTRPLKARGAAHTLDSQLSERFRRAILGGVLAAGERVPSARTLALEVGVARGTVVAVYERLINEGYLVARGAAGTFVSTVLPTRGGLVRDARPIHDSGTALPIHTVIAPFQLGVPAVDAFPMHVWSRLLSRRARTASAHDIARADPLGAPALRSAIASYLAVSRGVLARPEQIVITNGFQGALGLLCAAFPRASTWVEEPGYVLARYALLQAGMRVTSVPVDEQGIDPRRAGRAAPPKLIFVTTGHQMPLGMPLSLARRLSLLALARHSGAFIVEDDYDGEFHYEGPPLPALASLQPDAPVIYAGTFSKVLFPALRLGYLVVPEVLRERIASLATALSPAPASLPQLAVADFIGEGHFARHIKRMRALYRTRRDALLAALDEHASKLLDVAQGVGGLHVLARFPHDSRLDDQRVVTCARERGLGPIPFSVAFQRADRRRHGLLLGFPAISERRAEAHVVRLVQAIRAASK